LSSELQSSPSQPGPRKGAGGSSSTEAPRAEHVGRRCAAGRLRPPRAGGASGPGPGRRAGRGRGRGAGGAPRRALQEQCRPRGASARVGRVAAPGRGGHGGEGVAVAQRDAERRLRSRLRRAQLRGAARGRGRGADRWLRRGCLRGKASHAVARGAEGEEVQQGQQRVAGEFFPARRTPNG